MKKLEHFTFDIVQCKKELKLFNQLLLTQSLDERKDILPFFKKNKHLAAFIGSYIADINTFDRLAFEFPIYGDFVSDYVVGDSKSKNYCFIEFEDANKDSIFKKLKNKNNSEWSSRFEHGFSQIIDWFWKLSDMKKTDDFRNKYGIGHIRYFGLLIIGRDSYLTSEEVERLKWRLENIVVD